MFNRRARRSLANGFFVFLCGLATLLALSALGFILWSLVSQGVGGLNLNLFLKSTPAPVPSAACRTPSWAR